MPEIVRRGSVEQQLVQNAKEHFAACLVISSLSFMLFGFNMSQVIRYISKFWRRDHAIIRCWVLLVTVSNTASVLYGGVYADWLVSISFWSSYAHQNDVAQGVSSILYGFTLTTVQIFFCGCIFKMMPTRPRLRIVCCALISLVSLASFSIAICLGVILVNKFDDGISTTQSRLSRAIDSLTLLADVFILLTLIGNLIEIKTASKRLQRKIAKLSWVFCCAVGLSSLILIAEICIIYPSSTQSRYIIDFTYLYTPIYSFSMLKILNERTLYIVETEFYSEEGSIQEKVEARMVFTVDLESTTMVETQREEEMEMGTFARRARRTSDHEIQVVTPTDQGEEEQEQEDEDGEEEERRRSQDDDRDEDAIELAA